LRKLLVMGLLAGLMVGLLVLAGCGGNGTTVKTPEGEIEVEPDEGRATFTEEDGGGSITVEQRVPTEEELGAPIYPGAELEEGSAVSVTAQDEEGMTAATGATFITDDPFQEVVDWYTDRLGTPMYIETGETQEAAWMSGREGAGAEFSMVTVTYEEGETRITIVRATQ
jgi:hypothetical protein